MHYGAIFQPAIPETWQECFLHYSACFCCLENTTMTLIPTHLLARGSRAPGRRRSRTAPPGGSAAPARRRC